MFASKTRARCAIAFHAWLIAVIFFNALAPITVAASSLSEKDQPKTDTVKIDNASVEDVPAYQEEADDQTQTLPQELRDLALPAETPVPAATSATEEAVSKGPVLSLSADPDSIKAGGTLLLTWTIEGIVLEEHKLLSLQITLPDGFSLDGKYDGTYDEATRTLTISITTALSGQVNLLTNDSVTDSKMQAFLMESTDVLAEAGLFLPVHEEFVLDQQGGEIAVDEGQIKIEFPENVFSEQTVVEVGAPSKDAMPPYSLLGKVFEIKAQEKQSGEDLKQFSKEISIFVSYADLGIPEELEGDLYLYWYNPDIKAWEALPSMVNTTTKTLEAFTDHFTVFDIDVNNWQSARLPSVDSFQVSTFTGAGTYSLPIEAPPGQGGFQPSLSLNYNSQIVDQATTKAQASWVGMGWSLETGSIEVDTRGTGANRSDDTHLLNVGGVSTRIVKDSNGAYHTTDENFWKIDFASNVWTLKDKHGNTYYFEHTSSYAYQEGSCDTQNAEVLWDISGWYLTRVRNIFGQEIRYSYTNQPATVRMSQWYTGSGTCDNLVYLTPIAATYPATVTYSYSSASPNGRYRIRFGLANRSDFPLEWDSSPAAPTITFHTFEKYRLQNIYVEQDSNGDGTFETVIRRYELGFAVNTDPNIIFPGAAWTAGGKTSTLISVREYGVGGTTSLPATTFTYTDKLHLTRADNGYGGATEFAYETTPWYYTNDARPSQTIGVDFGAINSPCYLYDVLYSWGTSAGVVHCGGRNRNPLHIAGTPGIASANDIHNQPTSLYTNHNKEMVRPGGVYKLQAAMTLQPGMSTRLGLYDGIRHNWNGAGTYTFVQLPVDASRADPLIEATTGSTSQYALVDIYYFQLVASVYRVLTKRVQDGQGNTYQYSYSYQNNAGVDTAAVNAVDGYNERTSEFRGHAQVTETGPDGRKTVSQFYQDDILKGRPIAVTTYDGSRKLSQLNYYYTAVSLPCPICSTYGGIPRNWIRTDSVANTVYKANGVDYTSTKTFYAFESTYGNLITQEEKEWNGSAWVLYRTTTTEYYPNAAAYLVGFPAVQRINDGTGTQIAVTVNTYDINSIYAAPPTAGKLTRVLTWVKDTVTPVTYSLATYGYDQWGNRTTVTAYSEYAIGANSIPATGAQTTTTVFDPTYHTYPLSQTTPPPTGSGSGLTTSWTYDYTRSVPLTETDPNGNTTSAQYDIFGRMTKLIRPGNGDDSANPTVAIDYHDTNPFWTEIRQRIDTTRYVTIRRTYDGIGRQTKIERGSSPAGAGTFTLDNTVSFQYPTLNTAKQSMPYAPGGTAFYTTTVSDVLGRPLTITAPNGNATSYAYDGLATTITDPKGNSTTTTTDVWGRVISVAPPTGPDVTYTYDVLNNLKTATRGGVTTEIKYDYAGRKIGMDDPDMGMAGVIGDDLWGWKYEYDGLGNLTKQTDARGCTTNLFYDSLNRLSQKTYSNCPTTPNVTYYYDGQSFTFNGTLYNTFANALGRRTGMSVSGSNASVWGYDVRGRMTEETQDITGASSFTTEWDYNSADLIKWLKYPDDEQLTYIYNENGRLDTITSSLGSTYLADTQYDEAGRITSMDYGASVMRKMFDYFAWNTPDQGGLLQYAKTKRIADNVYLQDFAYDYDENANIETITDNQAGPQTQSFGYDALNRLTSAVAEGGGSNGLYNEAYTYNASTGNLASKAGVNYTYDENHVHAVASLSNDNTYQYDENGNMTDRNVGALTFDLAYDAENRLVSVTGNGTPPTATALPSQTPTATKTNTPTAAVTNTPTPSATPSQTQTPGGPTPTSTPTPTATNTPGGPTATATPTSSVNTITLQPDGTTGADTYLLNTSPTINNGTAVVMWVGESNNATNKVARSLIRFDLSSIPANATVLSATLSLWTDADFSDNDRMMRVYRLKAQFDESQATWNESATGVSWQSPGAAGADDRESADIGSIQILANETLDIEKQISLSAAQIQEMVNGTFTNNGFIIAADTELDDRFNYRTSDASAATKRPKLVIQYTLPQGKAPSNGFTFVNYSVPKVVQQSGSLNFTPADDAYIASGSPTSNYGSATTLQVDNSPVKHFLLKFDVAGINSGQVTSAKLCLYNVNSANEGGDFYRVADNSWQEETVTWNNAPAADTNLVASLGSVSPNTWYEVDLTSLITADGIYSLRVSDSVGGADYSSKEGSNSPKLLVSVEGAPVQSCAPAATATATPGPTNTPTLTATPGPSPTPTNISTATLVPTPTATVPPSAPFNNATFVYDGDGRRVKSTLNGSTTTYFVGNHYEVTGSTITKYYYAGAQRIAMRTNGTLNYLLGDHLGSTSLTTNASGQVVSELRYKAWGEVRYASGDPLTKYQYTGQYSHASDFGLLFYNARWLDPSLGRFAQADTTITGGVQGLDRYAYVNNSPLMYVDPTGHVSWPIIIGAAAVLTVGYTSLHLFGVLPDYRGTRFAKNYVTSKDPIVGAGIAVQSEYYGPWDTPSGAQIIESFTGGTSNIGIAQSSNAEMERLEIEGDPMNNADAVAIMTERIHSAQNACNGCNSTDLLIIAAMAQNGDLTAGGVGDILRNKDYRSSDPTHTIDWSAYFINGWQNPAPDPIAHLRENITGRQYNTRFMLGLYVKDLRKLLDDGWALPSGYEDVNWKYINDLQTRPSGRR